MSRDQNILFLETSAVADEIKIFLLDVFNQTVGEKVIVFTVDNTQSLLPELVALLKTAKVSWDDLLGTVVISGTKRFTIARLTALVANMLSWCKKIPTITANSCLTYQEAKQKLTISPAYQAAVYHKEPTITIGKKTA
ncbi:MAG: hypothetical protein A2233_00865 [Candidatus Kerfeldbacteria bacterium RIFOXYA2_FULL_38_24]|uniref:Gcp-like domain-containing protein n=1 Tax=Candidatus Kerfeldbacteria bacterium RIFOXYB2_FULL_38_14 TaxID=1798547 RepID=A0A1G2BGC3_9BACT|nr:MAG: hypothetical protein A2233_00865 [Candidatus Kerfeldbacteria bacterium RIFOXYA2_FULL_38_24]OGY88105.1 MAG: hypothetical protein A2319_01595 [Candidatus Kerfeldbacteria bacterium RIFOXYB2_FULL_38_14]OGY88462.1 MAG: hypothetical protein A2458_02480 [Candidatus Kerfeldbacteria bacterium RIFOXYC2_FULL_38_9]